MNVDEYMEHMAPDAKTIRAVVAALTTCETQRRC